MRTRNSILASVAAGTSLVLHALLLSASRAIEVPVATAPTIPASGEIAVVYAPPEATPELATQPQPMGEPEAELTIGEPDAKGYASHQVAGNREAVAPEAPADQAYLSLDPMGTSASVEMPAGGAGDAAADGAEAMQLTSVLPPIARLVDSLQAHLLPLPSARQDPVLPSVPSPSTADAEPNHEMDRSAGVPSRGFPTVPAAEAIPPARSKATAGAAADPAPQSDSESDAFSVLGSADYRDGRLTVRAGRKVRSRRPRIGLAGQVDLYQRHITQVTLRVTTDATGKVTGVEVVRSSGSNEVDQPCLVSMYDWWFEPKKDAAGRPVADRFHFTIGFR